MNIKNCYTTCAVVLACMTTISQPAQAVSAGAVGIDWSIKNAPPTGVNNIIYPITINPATLKQTGTYFAYQYYFTNSDDSGYTGLQPLDGGVNLRAIFSIFGNGTTTKDSNCSGGADGGSGVSCSVEFPATYGVTYAIVVSKSVKNTWIGKVVDTTTGTAYHIGSYTISPKGKNKDAGNIEVANGGGGFLEWYGEQPVDCTQLSKIDVIFGGPMTTTTGGLVGLTTPGTEYSTDSPCRGNVSNFQTEQLGNSVRIIRGWIGN